MTNNKPLHSESFLQNPSSDLPAMPEKDKDTTL